MSQGSPGGIISCLHVLTTGKAAAAQSPSTGGLTQGFITLFSDLLLLSIFPPNFQTQPAPLSVLPAFSLYFLFYSPCYVITFSLMYPQQGSCYCFVPSIVFSIQTLELWDMPEICVFYVIYKQNWVLHFPPYMQIFLSKL